jgi:hypothetical protein
MCVTAPTEIDFIDNLIVKSLALYFLFALLILKEMATAMLFFQEEYTGRIKSLSLIFQQRRPSCKPQAKQIALIHQLQKCA